MDTNPAGKQSQFFGQKVSIPGVNVNSAGDNELILKDDYSTRTYYGNNTTNGNNTNGPVLEIGQLPNGGSGIYIPDANGVGIAQFGQFADGSTALKVAQPGIEVSTATDPQLIFNSNQNIFKIVSSKKATIPTVVLSVSQFHWDALTIPHGLSYIPILQSYGLVNQYYNFIFPSFFTTTVSAYVSLPFNAQTGSLLDVSVERYEITAGVDATNVYFGWVYQTTSSGTGGSGYTFPAVPIRYYLLQETAN